MVLADIILLVFGGLGHVVFWVAIVNRIHAWALPRWVIDGTTLICGIALVSLPAAIAVHYLRYGITSWPPSLGRVGWLVYLALGSLVIAVAAAELLIANYRLQRCSALLSNHTRVVDLPETLGHQPVAGVPALLSRLPGNECLHLSIHEEALRIPRLSPAHEGLRIAHLSDLHMSGRIQQSVYAEIVRQTNALEPDLVAITGDLFDRSECLEWIGNTYAKLRARWGVYFVLGNHDRRVDHRHAVQLLVEAGLIYLGGRWLAANINGRDVLLAGNELPWFPPAADAETMPPRGEDGQPLRILLSHSPDQFGWAEAADFDLMLAGHTHGGQVQLPLLGAVLAPSREGTRFAAGIFQHDQTVMHVSRGTSNLAPLRWNCPPELSILELRGSEGDTSAAERWDGERSR